MVQNGAFKQVIKDILVHVGLCKTCPVCNTKLCFEGKDKWCTSCEYSLRQEWQKE